MNQSLRELNPLLMEVEPLQGNILMFTLFYAVLSFAIPFIKNATIERSIMERQGDFVTTF